MSQRWNEEQQQAIDRRGCDVMVAAAAGSGKTTVMVERIARMLLDGEMDAGNMAVVTFTRAAAAQMKTRIMARLSGESERENARARQQLERVDYAAIDTVHAFCSAVIRRHYPTAEVDPSLQVGDDTRMALLRQEVLKETLEGLFARADADFLDLASAFSGRDTHLLEELLASSYEFLRGYPRYRNVASHATDGFFSDDEALRTSPWVEALTADIAAQLSDALAMARHALAMPDIPEKYAAVFYEACDNIESALAGLQSNALTGGEKLVGNKPRVAKTDDPAIEARFAGLHKAVRYLCTNALKNPLLTDFDRLAANTRAAAPQLRALMQALLAYDEAYAAAKAKNYVVDYNDLEHLALKVLDDPAAGSEVRARYSHVFVDEYQDISPVQEAILRALRTPGQYFGVGDVKQSIYRFRAAAPELFQAAIARGEAEPDACSIYLTRNYRSAAQVVDFVNLVFSRVMSPQLGEVAYDHSQRLDCGREPVIYPNPSVELQIVDGQGMKEGQLADLDSLLACQREAVIAARRITDLMGQPLWDAKIGAMRPAGYDDFAILLRRRAVAGAYAQVLRQAGIPVVTDTSEGLAGELETALLAALLRLIDNSRRDDDLITVLHSPLYGITMQEMLAIRAANTQEPYHKAALACACKNDELGQKLSAFFAQMDAWRGLSCLVSVGDLTRRVVADTALYDIAAALPGGERRRRNLLCVMAAADGFDEPLHIFARKLDAILSQLHPQVGENDATQAVRIMTIHKSKGLEFPVVLLAQMGAGFNMRDAQGDMLTHRRLGFGPRALYAKTRVKGDTLPRVAVAALNKRESQSEEMRILYVALTRARERLVMIGSVSDYEQRLEDWQMPPLGGLLAGKASYLNWVCTALADAGITADSPAYAGHTLGIHRHIASDIHLQSGPADSFTARQARVQALFAADADTADLEAYFAWEYPHRQSGKLPAKLAATALLDAYADRHSVRPLVDTPDFIVQKQKFTALDRGTFTHTLLQHIAPGDDPNALAASLEERALLPQGGAQAIHYSHVTRFLDSEIARRMQASPLVRREESFNLRLRASEVYPDNPSAQPVMVQGIIDCCFMEGGQWVLVDYKTNRVDAEHTPEFYARYYAPQLRIYRMALERITNTPVKECWLCLISSGENILVE